MQKGPEIAAGEKIYDPSSLPDEPGHLSSAKRLGSVFLQKLGVAVEEKSEVLFGVPEISDSTQAHDAADMLKLDGSCVDAAVFGGGSFAISYGDIERLKKTTALTLTEDLPPRFYSALFAVTSRSENAQFFSTFRTVPLYNLVSAEWRDCCVNRLKKAADDAIRSRTQVKERLCNVIHSAVKSHAGQEHHLRTLEAEIANLSSNINFVSTMVVADAVDAVANLLNDSLANPADYGFSDLKHVRHTMGLSLLELSSSVCVSQEGYSFVDSSAAATNQLCSMTTYASTVVYLAAVTLDAGPFLSAVCRQGEHPDTTKLEQKLKELYRLVFTAAGQHRVRNPSMVCLAYSKDRQDLVSTACVRAQLELLGEKDWGFETYWLNVGDHHVLIEGFLRDWGSDSKPTECQVVLHKCHPKFVASELAKQQNKAPALLVPSECSSVMQGFVGYDWQLGCQSFGLEQDVVSTSTFVLAHGSLTSAYTERRHMRHVSVGQAYVERSGTLASSRLKEQGGVLAVLGMTAHTLASLSRIAADTADFGFFNIVGPSGTTMSPGVASGDGALPLKLRPAAVFLELLGRSSQRTEVVEGVPNVGLSEPLCARDPASVLELSAASMSRHGGQPHGVSCEAAFGTAAFSVTVQEVRRLESTARVAVVAADLPPSFYTAMAQQTTSKDCVRFFSYLRSVPLANLCSSDAWDSALRHETQRSADAARALEGLSAADVPTFAATTQELRDSQAQVAFFSDRAPESELLLSCERWRIFIAEVQRHPLRYGFVSQRHCTATLAKALTELCSSVCLSQEGYFFVSGRRGSGSGAGANQLCKRTEQPVVFLHASGLDFRTPSTTRLEMPKYFEELPPDDSQGVLKRWRCFRECGRADLMARLRNLYRAVFTSAMHHGVKNVSALPLGLGTHLENVFFKEHVVEAYFSAQFELLSEEEWGFETYWLNPQQHREAARALLKRGVDSGSYRFRCNIVLHSSDAKFLAVELAMQGRSAGVVCPSSCVALMQGITGNRWETGLGSAYAGEEDMCATGTGVLATSSICSVYTDRRRVMEVATCLPAHLFCCESREYRKGAFLYQLSETDRQSEETKAQERVDEMHSIATEAAVFQQREVVRAETPEQTYNYAAILPDRRFHDRMRPAAAFLSLLGRSHDDADVVSGVPHVGLTLDGTRAGTVALDAEALDRHASGGDPDSGGEKAALMLFGAGRFDLPLKEVQRLQESARVMLGTSLPPPFYQALMALTTGRSHAPFFQALEHVPLAKLSSKDVWKAHVKAAQKVLAAAKKRLHAIDSDKKGAGGRKKKELRQILWARHKEESLAASSQAVEETLQSGHGDSFRDVWEGFLESVMREPMSFGFRSVHQLHDTLSQSLVELQTDVCVSIEGYYFVQGKSVADPACGMPTDLTNDLCAPTPQPVVMLFASGIDFATPESACVELKKYFVDTRAGADTDLGTRFKGFVKGGQEMMYARIKEVYQTVFTLAKQNCVNNPCVVPLGLARSLLNINAEDHDAVIALYFRAQFELLARECWGFETYWLNAGDNRSAAESMLNRVTLSHPLRCSLVLHNRDSKCLAVELAKKGMVAATVVPAGCPSLLLGLVGNRWEHGRAAQYSSEEDTAATSTAVLAGCGANNVFVDPGRMRQTKPRLVNAGLDKVSEEGSDLGDEADTAWLHFHEQIGTHTLHAAVTHVAELRRFGVGEDERDRLLVEMEEYLSSHGERMQWSDKKNAGKTLMYLAASGGDLEVAQLLHRNGSPLCEQGLYLDSPLHGAALHCHVDVCIWLILSGHPLNCIDKQGFSVFDSALCRLGFPDCKYKTEEQAQMTYKALQASPTVETLAQWKATADPADDHAARWTKQLASGVMTDLHVAIITNVKRDQDKLFRSIERCAQDGQGELCRRLLNAPGPGNWRPLHWAVVCGNDDAVAFLLGATAWRAETDVRGNDGWTPLHWAVLLGRRGYVDSLLSLEADRTRPIHLVRHIWFQEGIWEDAKDPSQYVLRMNGEMLMRTSAKGMLGPWMKKSRTVRHRKFHAVQHLKDGLAEKVVVSVMLALTRRHQQSLTYRLSVNDEDGRPLWQGTYDAKAGSITRRCSQTAGKKPCDFPLGSADLRCKLCSCRQYFPGGLRPSIDLAKAMRGRRSGTALHAAIKAATMPAVCGSIARPCSQDDGEYIARKLMERQQELTTNRRFLLELNNEGNAAFTLIVRGLEWSFQTNELRGLRLVRAFWGCKSVDAEVSAHPEAGRLPMDSLFQADGASTERLHVSKLSLMLSEQLIPIMLSITAPKSHGYLSGRYERVAYRGSNNFPEYKMVSGMRVFVLRASDSGKWVVGRRQGQAFAEVVESREHGGVYPQYIDGWRPCSASADSEDFEMRVSGDPMALSQNAAAVPKEHLQMGWLLTMRARCSEPVVLAFLRAMSGSGGGVVYGPAELRSCGVHAVCNTACLPGPKGAGDARMLQDSLAFHRLTEKELGQQLSEAALVNLTVGRADSDDDDGAASSVVSGAVARSRVSRVDASSIGTILRGMEEDGGGHGFDGVSHAPMGGGSLEEGDLLGSALHIATIFGRPHNIRVLVEKENATVEGRHIKTALFWERWEEALVLLDYMRAAELGQGNPLSEFTNVTTKDGHAAYTALPTLQEIQFCHKHDIAAPSAYLELASSHVQLLRNLSLAAGRKGSRRWVEIGAEEQDKLRYLLSVDAIDYYNLFRDPESRKAFDGFDFGATPRSAEMYLSLAKTLSCPSVKAALDSVKGLTSEWFPNGFTVAGVKFDPTEYSALEFPLHVMLAKGHSRYAESVYMTEGNMEVVEYKKACKNLCLDCVKLINECAAKKGTNNELLDLASVVPRQPRLGERLVCRVLPREQNLFVRELVARVRRRRTLSKQNLPCEGVFRMQAYARTQQMVLASKTVDISEPRWRLLPIELTIELNLFDVLAQMLQGGVMESNQPILSTESDGSNLHFAGFRDIWFPGSAEFVVVETDDSSEEQVNWRRFNADNPPLLHRCLDKLSVPLHSANNEAMINKRGLFFDLESPVIPHIPPSGQMRELYNEPVCEHDKECRDMVLMLLKASFEHKRGSMNKAVSGLRRNASIRNKAQIVNLSYRASQAQDAGSAEPGDDSSSDGDNDDGQEELASGGLVAKVQHIGPYFDRCGLYAFGPKKWFATSLAAATAGIAAALVLTCRVADCLRVSKFGFAELMAPREGGDDVGIQGATTASFFSEMVDDKPTKEPVIAEYGLAKLLQRAPWVTFDTSRKALFPLVLRSHPYPNIDTLEAHLVASHTAIFVERRHRWQRTLWKNNDQGWHRHSRYLLGPPGEQDAVRDEKLSLLHWLCVLGAPDALRLATHELRTAVMKHDASDVVVPKHCSKTGFSPAHYAAYSACDACLNLLVEQADRDAGEVAVRELANYQVRCRCPQHQGVSWKTSFDAGLHHSRLLITAGDSPLTICSQFAHFKVMSLLLEHGADTLLRNCEGFDCHDVAIALSFRFQLQYGLSKAQFSHLSRVGEEGYDETSDIMGILENAEDSADGGVQESDGARHAEEVQVLNHHVSTLNVNDGIRRKLQSFAQGQAVQSGVFYVFFLVLLVVVVLHATGHNDDTYRSRFWAGQAVAGVADEPATPERDETGQLFPFFDDFTSAGAVSDVVRWLQSVIPVLLADSPANQEYCSSTPSAAYRLVGSLRLSLLRVEPEPCAIPDALLAVRNTSDPCFKTTPVCYPEYDKDVKRNTKPIFPKRWENQAIYEWRSPHTRILYDVGKGEAIDLAWHNKEWSDMVMRGAFVDPTLRMITLMVTYYHPFVASTVVGAFHIEVLGYGTVKTSVDIVSAKVPHSFEEWTADTYFVFEIILVVYLLDIIIETGRSVVTFVRILLMKLYAMAAELVLDTHGEEHKRQREALEAQVSEAASRAATRRASISSQGAGLRRPSVAADQLAIAISDDKTVDDVDEDMKGRPDNEDQDNGTGDGTPRRKVGFLPDNEAPVACAASNDASSDADGDDSDYSLLGDDDDVVPNVSALVVRQELRCDCGACRGGGQLGAVFATASRYLVFAFGTVRLVLRETVLYLFGSWTLVNCLMTFCMCMCIYLRLYMIHISDSGELEQYLVSAPGDTYNEEFLRIARKYVMFSHFAGVTILLCFVKLLKVVMIVPKIGPVISAIIKTMSDVKVLLFFWLFLFMLAAFVICLYVAYGGSLHQYHTFFFAVASTFRMVIGDFPGENGGGYEDLIKAERSAGPAVYAVIVVFMQLLFLNVLIAVIGEVYAAHVESTNNVWARDICMLYQHKLCRRPDPQENPFQDLAGIVRRGDSALAFSETDDRMKTPLAHNVPWVIVSPETVECYGDHTRDVSMTLAEINAVIRRTSDTTMELLEQNREEMVTVRRQNPSHETAAS